MTFLIDASRVVFPPFLCDQSSLMSIQKFVLGSVHEHAFCLAKSLSRHVNCRVNGGAGHFTENLSVSVTDGMKRQKI